MITARSALCVLLSLAACTLPSIVLPTALAAKPTPPGAPMPTDGRLTALYTYVSEGETRHVRSVLAREPDGLYRGSCATTVAGSPRFSVRTTLLFADDGTASGNWAWSGEPSATDPAVVIRRRDGPSRL